MNIVDNHCKVKVVEILSKNIQIFDPQYLHDIIMSVTDNRDKIKILKILSRKVNQFHSMHLLETIKDICSNGTNQTTMRITYAHKAQVVEIITSCSIDFDSNDLYDIISEFDNDSDKILITELLLQDIKQYDPFELLKILKTLETVNKIFEISKLLSPFIKELPEDSEQEKLFQEMHSMFGDISEFQDSLEDLYRLFKLKTCTSTNML